MKKTKQILQKLNKLTELLVAHKLLQKEVLTFSEAAQYLDLSPSNLYQMVSEEVVPSYKPYGKKLYFNRLELNEWLMSNKQSSSSEFDKMIDDFTFE